MVTLTLENPGINNECFKAAKAQVEGTKCAHNDRLKNSVRCARLATATVAIALFTTLLSPMAAPDLAHRALYLMEGCLACALGLLLIEIVESGAKFSFKLPIFNKKTDSTSAVESESWSQEGFIAMPCLDTKSINSNWVKSVSDLTNKINEHNDDIQIVHRFGSIAFLLTAAQTTLVVAVHVFAAKALIPTVAAAGAVSFIASLLFTSCAYSHYPFKFDTPLLCTKEQLLLTEAARHQIAVAADETKKAAVIGAAVGATTLLRGLIRGLSQLHPH